MGVRVIVDAIRYEEVVGADSSNLLPHVLSMPRRCPCGDTWMILLDEPCALEVELGNAGQTHLALLLEAMQKDCTDHKERNHLRTDGEKVWFPA